MRVRVKLFSVFRDCVPGADRRGQLDVELCCDASVRVLLQQLDLGHCLEADLSLEEMMGTSWQVMLNGKHLSDLERGLKEGDQIAIFPPMAGGSKAPWQQRMKEDDCSRNKR